MPSHFETCEVSLVTSRKLGDEFFPHRIITLEEENRFGTLRVNKTIVRNNEPLREFPTDLPEPNGVTNAFWEYIGELI